MSSNDFYSEMPPPNYQNYGAPPPPPRRRNWGLWGGLGIIGGGCGLILLCCCCCVIGFYAIFQSPILVVSVWGGMMQNSTPTEEASSFVVCPNTQAETYMAEIVADNAYLTGTFNTVELGDKKVRGSATMVRNGETDSGWSAVFTVQSGGTFGSCISEIQED